MSLFISSLNSGSNANCYYIGNPDEAVLVDAGLSCRETEKRMRQLELSPEKLKAIFITHEHSDHITGLAGLSKKYRLPVYITAPTLEGCRLPVEPGLVRSFQKNKPVSIGKLVITPFRKHHDAADPHSFIVSGHGVHVGVITDIGYACKQVTKYFSRCHAVFLEANYCPAMLASGHYPYHLQQRIRSDEGHLSNEQALELFRDHRSPELQLLVLSHLSKHNNRPELVESLFSREAGPVSIVVASRYAPTPVYRIEAGKSGLPVAVRKRRGKNNTQLSLFSH